MTDSFTTKSTSLTTLCENKPDIADKMVKSTKKTTTLANAASKIPAAPWIYINDSTPGGHITEELTRLIPNTFLITTFHCQNRLEFQGSLSKAKAGVNIIRDTRGDREDKAKKDAIQIVKTTAMKAGTNCVSIDIINDPFIPRTPIALAASNHLNLVAGPGSAQAIYQWLCEFPKRSVYAHELIQSQSLFSQFVKPFTSSPMLIWKRLIPSCSRTTSTVRSAKLVQGRKMQRYNSLR